MECPKCGSQNAETNRFCLKCGYKLPDRPAQEMPQPRPLPPLAQGLPKDPASQIALICGITGIVGGGLTVLGWLLPWFGVRGLASEALNLLGIGSRSRLLSLGSGVGTGPQMSLFLLLVSLATFRSGDYTALFGVLGLTILGVFVAVPILGVQNVRSGGRAIQLRTASGTKPVDRSGLTYLVGSMRSRSGYVLGIMLIIFIGMTVIPFGTSALGGGFYLTVIGAVCSYLGPFFYQSRLSSLSNTICFLNNRDIMK